MSDEIRVDLKIKITNGEFIIPQLGGLQQITQTVPFGGVPGMILLTTGDTIISLTGITSLGWMYIKNCDATNYITYGPTVAGAIAPFGKLKPGEWTIVRLLPGIVLRAQANTSSCKTQILIFDD